MQLDSTSMDQWILPFWTLKDKSVVSQSQHLTLRDSLCVHGVYCIILNLVMYTMVMTLMTRIVLNTWAMSSISTHFVPLYIFSSKCCHLIVSNQSECKKETNPKAHGEFLNYIFSLYSIHSIENVMLLFHWKFLNCNIFHLKLYWFCYWHLRDADKALWI